MKPNKGREDHEMVLQSQDRHKVVILVSAKKLRFLIEPCFSVGAASSREWLTVAAGSRSYKNESFDA
jgi:hypothetical protein